MNDTITIEGYTYKVTAFPTLSEARAARDIAMAEMENVKSVSTIWLKKHGVYAVLCYYLTEEGFYL